MNLTNTNNANNEDYVILTGTSNIELAQLFAKLLGQPVEHCSSSFSNTESRIQIKNRIDGKDVIIIQSGSFDGERSVNDHLMDTILIMDACRRSDCNRIYLILALYPYSRQDKRTSRSPISASVVGKMISNYDATVLTIDLHSGQTQGFIDRKFHNFYGTNVFMNELKRIISYSDDPTEEFVLVAPDYGGAERINAYAKKLKLKHVAMCKFRDNTKPNIVENTCIPLIDFDLTDRTAIVIDDMADTMGTMISCCNKLTTKYRIRNVIIVITHGIFSGSAISKINNCKSITKVLTTDTISQTKNIMLCPKIELVSVAPLFAKAITIIKDKHKKKRVETLFKVQSSDKLDSITEESLFDAIN